MKNITNKSVKEDINVIIELLCRYRDAIWENQEGQPDHFDNLPKAEQMALLGIANNVVALYQSLINYKQWFQ